MPVACLTYTRQGGSSFEHRASSEFLFHPDKYLGWECVSLQVPSRAGGGGGGGGGGGSCQISRSNRIRGYMRITYPRIIYSSRSLTHDNSLITNMLLYRNWCTTNYY